MADRPKKEFVLDYRDSAHIVTIPVTGAFGGATPTGDSLMVNLYCEFPRTPESFIAKIPEGTEVKVPGLYGEGPVGITREIQARMMVSKQAAISIGQWLLKNANEMPDKIDLLKYNPKVVKGE